MPHEFIVPIHDLDAGGKHLTFPVRAAWVTAQLEDQEPTSSGEDGVFDVRISKSGHDVVVHGTLRATLTMPCSRCLNPANVPIDQTVSVLMVPAAHVKAPKSSQNEEYEFSPEEADVLPYDGDTVVLDDLVRDELMLEIPMIHLCSENCPGISPPPAGQIDTQAKSTEDTIDPRLAPLLKIKPKKES